MFALFREKKYFCGLYQCIFLSELSVYHLKTFVYREVSVFHLSTSFGIAVSSYMVLMQETPLSSPQIILHVLGVQLPLKIVCFYI